MVARSLTPVMAWLASPDCMGRSGTAVHGAGLAALAQGPSSGTLRSGTTGSVPEIESSLFDRLIALPPFCGASYVGGIPNPAGSDRPAIGDLSRRRPLL